MAGTTINRQPIFTATPILISKKVTLSTPTNLYNADNVVDIYTDASTYGTLINRITVSTDGTIGASIPNTTIYLYLYDSTNTEYNLYKSAPIAAVGSVGYQVVPYVEFTFDGGLITKSGTKIALGTTNNGTNYAAILEGGTYDYTTV
jgi:hypothetical protein